MQSTKFTTILLIVPVLFLCSIFLMHQQQSLAEDREILFESTTIQSTTVDPKQEAREKCTKEKEPHAEWQNTSLCIFENMVCEQAGVNLFDVCKEDNNVFEEVCGCEEGFMRQSKGGKGKCVEKEKCQDDGIKEKKCKEDENAEWTEVDSCMEIPTCNKQSPEKIPNCVEKTSMGCKCKAGFFHQDADVFSPCVTAEMCTQLDELKNKFVAPPSLEIEEDPDYYD